ncbi:MAG: beta-lactamase family protein [Actinomycetota bacterium]|nr:beta-lactamase family protein [Actinomycetota bacterium]
MVAACSDEGESAQTNAAVTSPANAALTTSATGAETSAPTTPVTSEATSEPTAATPTTFLVPGEEWSRSSPAEQGLDPAPLRRARRYAFAEGRNTQGVVVVYRGEIIAEWYDAGADAQSWAASWSMAKSVTSASIGIAISEGLIPSVDEPMTTYYPEWKGTDRQDITLRDVLQMSSGLRWQENYDPSSIDSSDIIQIVVFRANQLAYVADRPSAEEPGSVFNYSSGDTLLLSGVLEQATGMSAEEYARRKIFEPIGMEQVEWWQDAKQHTLTYCCLDATSRDFARFGWLYLNGGRWGEEQVVPPDWVDESLQPSEAFEGYGYQWWLTGREDERLPDDLFSARGFDGQYIYVVPSLDLVIVRNGTYMKHPGDPVADPSLFEYYPSGSLNPSLGTLRPESGWDDVEFLSPIIESIEQQA